MEIRTPGRTTEAGFTIVEVMVAMVLLLTGVLGLVQMADTANKLTVNNRTRVEATGLARQVIETARDISYSSLSDASLVSSLQAQAGLADADVTTPGWQILNSRQNRDFTITAAVCTLDDDKDGARATGANAPSGTGVGPGRNAAGFCTQSIGENTTPTNVDGNPDDYRRINVNVSWVRPTGVTVSCGGDSGGSGTSCVTQSTLISNPSGGLGPNIKTVSHKPHPPAAFNPTPWVDPMEEAAVTSADFDVETQSGADQVNWNMDDGKSNGTAIANTGDTTGTLWHFTWDFGDKSKTVDGTYTATLQAFLSNSGGNAFPHQVTLNRYIPSAPNVVNQDVPSGTTNNPATGGGVNTRLATLTQVPPAPPTAASNHVVELKWNKNPERDIVGYEVFKASAALPGLTASDLVANGGTVTHILNCDVPATVTSCYDPSPLPSGLMNYYVVALDQTWKHSSDPLAYDCDGVVGTEFNISYTAGLFATGQRPGCPSVAIPVNITAGIADQRPAFGATLTNPVATSTATGLPVLSWSAVAPSPNTATDGDKILFYRIYRDPSGTPPATPNYASRVGTTSNGLQQSFEDNTPGVGSASTHIYWVVAVDEHYNESDPIGPATWTAP